ncbi:MAG: Glutamine amidotransferase [Aeromicrobium sp.]|nr:Glutamine amidotransferase [Aeromicrobium sp.]
MTKPLIGITTYREQARWGVWDEPADLLPTAYARSIEAAGGVAVLLPPSDADAALAVVGRLDALIIAGGADVDPWQYGAEPHTKTAGWRLDRDTWELALLDAAREARLPALGICRGMQIMAVHAGGSLEQHVPDLVGHEDHSPGADQYGEIGVEVVPGTRLAGAIGERGAVACHHHQSVREHPGFVASAHAADGTTEAMEHEDRPFWLAVQWHPETREDAGLFRSLVDAAQNR